MLETPGISTGLWKLQGGAEQCGWGGRGAAGCPAGQGSVYSRGGRAAAGSAGEDSRSAAPSGSSNDALASPAVRGHQARHAGQQLGGRRRAGGRRAGGRRAGGRAGCAHAPEEEAGVGALLGLQLKQVLALVPRGAADDLVVRVPHQHLYRAGGSAGCSGREQAAAAAAGGGGGSRRRRRLQAAAAAGAAAHRRARARLRVQVAAARPPFTERGSRQRGGTSLPRSSTPAGQPCVGPRSPWTECSCRSRSCP